MWLVDREIVVETRGKKSQPVLLGLWCALLCWCGQSLVLFLFELDPGCLVVLKLSHLMWADWKPVNRTDLRQSRILQPAQTKTVANTAYSHEAPCIGCPRRTRCWILILDTSQASAFLRCSFEFFVLRDGTHALNICLFSAGPDSTDAATASSNGERFTPTPRRSIHSYKVTETTRQTLTKVNSDLLLSTVLWMYGLLAGLQIKPAL